MEYAELVGIRRNFLGCSRAVSKVFFLVVLLVVAGVAGTIYVLFYPRRGEELHYVKIGIPADLTYLEDRFVVRGAQLAAEEINIRGGVLGRNLTIIVRECVKHALMPEPDYTPSRVVGKLIVQNKCDAIIGFDYSYASVEVACRYHTVYFSVDAHAHYYEKIFQDMIAKNYTKYKYAFFMTPNSTVLGTRMTEFYGWLKDTYGFNTTYILAEEYVWCDSIIEYCQNHLPEHGWTIIKVTRFPSTTTTFTPYLTEAKNAGAQVIMPLIALDWAVTFHKEWAAMQYGFTAGLATSSERSTYWEETDGACKYHLELGPGLPRSNVTEKSSQFYNAYSAKYGEYPLCWAEQSYAVVYAYAEAVERAGTLDSDAVVAELEKTDMVTPYSRLKFGSTHEPRAGAEYWPSQFSQWMDTGYRPTVWSEVSTFLTPERIAYADLTLPPWI